MTTILLALWVVSVAFILTGHDPVGRSLNRLCVSMGPRIGTWAERLFILVGYLGACSYCEQRLRK